VQIANKFILSVNDLPETREIFPPLRDRHGRDALYRVRQVVRRDRDRRHRTISGAAPGFVRPAVVFGGG
jgi:hypothetical protein